MELVWKLWPYAAAVALVVGIGWYIHHDGEDDGANKVTASQNDDLKAQLAAQQTFAVAAQDLKEKQIKEAGDVNKEIDKAYNSGCVPQRVRKFYIDQAPPACGANVPR